MPNTLRAILALGRRWRAPQPAAACPARAARRRAARRTTYVTDRKGALRRTNPKPRRQPRPTR